MKTVTREMTRLELLICLLLGVVWASTAHVDDLHVPSHEEQVEYVEVCHK